MSEQITFDPHLVLPVGTQIVSRIDIRSASNELICPRGVVGVIINSPADNFHSYRVRFPNGYEASLKRHDIAVRKQFRRDSLEQGVHPDSQELYKYIIYRCVVGSRAYGLDNADSDTDRRGIYLPPADLHWSLTGIPEQLENEEAQECFWEIQKFISLALKANPNILECLNTPLVEFATPLAEELLSIRGIFLSKLIYQTYNGYVMSQFKKLEQDIRLKGSPRWKHAMHLIRLLLSGITILQEGFVPVHVEIYRDQLLRIRNEEMSWEDLNSWRLNLHKGFDKAFLETQLPELPDYERANQFLIKARRSMVDAS